MTVPDSLSEHGHDALRADIRRLSTLLGQTIAHHGGPELLELVEQVRKVSRAAIASGDDAAITDAALRASTRAPPSALARAFSQFFQLANIAEQRHRAGELRRCAAAAARCAIMQRLADGPGTRDEVNAVLARLELRPVFTAHPTEASRQSVLAILRRVADALDRGRTTTARRARRPALADRRAAPRQAHRRRRGPRDGWYMEQLGRGAVPDLLGELDREVRAAGFTVPEDARPLVLGCWVGGDRDGNPNVTPAVTREVLELYTDRALRDPREPGGAAASELSISTRVVGVSEELRASLAARPAAAARGLRPRNRLNAHEPYRLKLSYVQARLADTRTRIATGARAPARPRLPRPAGLRRRTCGHRPLPARATSAAASPTARSPARCARPRRSGCTWPSWTSASTRQAPRRARRPSTTRSASWTSPTPS